MIRKVTLIGGLVLFLIFCGLAGGDSSESKGTSVAPVALDPADVFGGFCATDEGKIDALIAQMSLRDKVAQMFMVGPAAFSWYTPGATKKLISELGLGGVFLQPVKSIPTGGDPTKVAKVVANMQELALSRNPSIPLIFSLDQEGGIPQAFQSLFGGTDGPGNPTLAATGDPENTYLSYSIMGREVRAIGAHVALAPVLDRMPSHECRPMYTRTFGQNVEQVDAHAGQAVKGFQDNGVVACIKHFPGGGGAYGDPHYSRPFTDETEQEIRDLHLKPFVTALSAGADMVMTGQIRFSCWEDKFPSGLSKKIKLDLLRGELGYDGVLLTDDMNMGAITGRDSLSGHDAPDIDWGEDVNVLSIQTGSDMILNVDGVDFDYVAGLVNDVIKAVEDGRLTEERIDQSVRRILRLKQKYCLFEKPMSEPNTVKKVVGSKKHRIASKEIMAQGMTLVKNDEGLFPLDRTSTGKVLAISPLKWMFRDPGNTFANASGTTLAEEIERLKPGTQTVHYMPGSLNFLMDRAVGKAKNTDADVIVLVTHNAHYDPPQIEMAKRILALGKPVIVISEATPYELTDFPEASTYLCTYNSRTLALETAAEVLFGMHKPLGRLPVELEGLYPVGHSVYAPSAL